MKKAVFAAGCFWGVEKHFRRVHGVTGTLVGYTGGHKENPTYKDVCSETTGHAEAIEVTFDEKYISYKELLDVFWKIHDPTQADGQGMDIGTSYRSAIFYRDEKQKQKAIQSKEHMQKSIPRPLATEIVEFTVFYPAEEEHQRYLEKRNC